MPATALPSDPPPEPLDWRPPPPLRQRIGRAASVPAAAAAVVFVAIVLVSIATVWLRPHAIGADDGRGSESTLLSEQPGSASGAAADDAPAEAAAEPLQAGSVFVHVVGEVHEPGVYELEAGSRVSAALDAAGGSTEAAVLSGINLARVLADGEQIVVPDAEGAAAAAMAAAPAAPGAGSGSSPGSPVNLNTADAAALETLPRVGPALAARIIDWRNVNGRFASVEQLLDVSGIGQKTFEQLRELVTV